MIAALVVLAGFLAGYGVALRRLRSRRPAALPFDPRCLR
jgi:hypothetical protein